MAAGAVDLGGASRAWIWATAILAAGAFAAAISMAPSTSAAPGRALVWLLFLGSSVHVASTGWLYTLPEIRGYARQRPLRYIWIPIGLVVVGAAIAALASPTEMKWLLLPYFAWQFFHFQKQNLGMAALAASAHGLRLHPSERRAMVVGGAAGIVGLIAHPGLLQLRVRIPIGRLFALAAVVFAGAVGWGLWSLARRPTLDRPIGFSAIYLLSLLFSFPIFTFPSPYAAVGGMTIAHGLQYLLLVGLVAAGDGHRATSRTRRAVVLCNIALAGGALLSGASHLHGSSPALRLLFGAYLGVVMSHFVIDAGLWRMRDPFPRQFLGRHLPYLVTPVTGALPEPVIGRSPIAVHRQPI